MKNMMVRLFKEEDGQGLTEYGLLVGLIALVVVGAVAALGTKVDGIFDSITEKLGGETTPKKTD